jgi:predicted nucleic acid-binding protein
MILVDSSVWIEVLRGNRRDEFARATADEEVVTCLPVMQEVLQGIDDDDAYRVAAAAFADIRKLEDPLTREVFDSAIQLYRSARRSAVTVRSSVDCLIAVCAMRNDAVVLHTDRDFTHLGRIAALRVRRF